MNNSMKILSILLAAAALLSCTPPAETAQELALRFNTPAAAWEETLPLGNGRIGMMPDGGIDKELIVLNDITMWSGSEDPEALNPEALNYLPKIRELLLTGKNGEAQRMMYDHFQCGGLGSSGGKSKSLVIPITSVLAVIRRNASSTDTLPLPISCASIPCPNR